MESFADFTLAGTHLEPRSVSALGTASELDRRFPSSETGELFTGWIGSQNIQRKVKIYVDKRPALKNKCMYLSCYVPTVHQHIHANRFGAANAAYFSAYFSTYISWKSLYHSVDFPWSFGHSYECITAQIELLPYKSSLSFSFVLV